ncbi:hypothetical protein [Geotalea toluenoxydans]
MATDIEKMMCWGRYLYWTNLGKERFDALLESYASPDEIPSGEYFAHSSQWFASLYVVIEGWGELKLQDAAIEKLLSEFDALQSLLRRYRNGVFHFQPNLLDKRFTELAKSTYNWTRWIRVLHDEFVRYFSDWLAGLSIDPDESREIKESIKASIGWIPDETLTDKIRNLQTLVIESEALLAGASDDSLAGKELQEAIEKVKDQIAKSTSEYEAMIDKHVREMKGP